MTDVDDLLVPKKEPKRDRWGRYLLPDPATGAETAYQRVTTLARMMADTFALERWQVRMTAKGLALRPDLFAQVAAATLDEKTLLNDVCDLAQEAAGATVGRNAGSAMHRFTQRLNAGETVEVPAPFDRDLAAYQRARAELGITTLGDMAERIVVVPEIGVAGTFDELVHAPSWTRPKVADLKTAQHMYDWLAAIIQLACYAHGAVVYDLDTGTYTAMPDVDQDRALVLHAPAGTGECTIFEVDIAAGWEAAQIAVEVREWRKRRDLAVAVTGQSAPAPAGTPDDGGLRAEHARQRLMRLAELGASVVWPAGVQTFKEVRLSKHVYNHDELLAIEAALSEAEKQIDAPFPPAEPSAEPELVQRMVVRLEALPSDLLARVVDASKPHLIPNLRSTQVSIRHLEILETIVAPAEIEAAQRTDDTVGLLGEYGDDPAIAAAILALAGCTDTVVDDTARPRVEAITAALDELILVVRFDDDGTAVIAAGDQAETVLLALGGGARAQAVLAVKEIADRHGLRRPRSFAVALSDPLLCALAAHTARQPA